MRNLMRVNPKHRGTRDQVLRASTAAIAGPALIYAGYKFPGSFGAKGALVFLGIALTYSNYGTFHEALQKDSEGE